jgi:hypothetical protein
MAGTPPIKHHGVVRRDWSIVEVLSLTGCVIPINSSPAATRHSLARYGGCRFLARYGGCRFLARYGGCRFLPRYGGCRFLPRYGASPVSSVKSSIG